MGNNREYNLTFDLIFPSLSVLSVDYISFQCSPKENKMSDNI